MNAVREHFHRAHLTRRHRLHSGRREFAVRSEALPALPVSQSRVLVIDPARPLLPHNRPPVSMIVAVVAEAYDLCPEDLLSDTHLGKIVLPRQIAMWLARRLTKRSLPDVGGRFNRHHASIIHALRKIDGLRADNSALVDKIGEIETEIALRFNGIRTRAQA